MEVESENLEEQDIPNIENYTDSILFKSFLKDDTDSKQELKLSKEITKKKIQISHMFNKKFGKNFLNQKPEALINFEKQLKKYLFIPNGKFLSKLPKLQKRIIREGRAPVPFLSSKIDMGGMVLYDLRGKKNKKITDSDIVKEKLLTASKNFTSTPVKDIIGNAFYKAKFWDKNSKRLNIVLKNRLSKFRDNYFDEEEQEIDNNYINLILDDEDNSSNITKYYNSQREKGNLKYNSINNFINNNNINNLNTNNNILLNQNIVGESKANTSDKKERSSIDIKTNNSNSSRVKNSKNKRYSLRYIQNYFENEKFINSSTFDSKNLYTKSNFYNKSRNKNNNSNLFSKSNTYRKNSNNNKIDSYNALNTFSNLNYNYKDINNHIFKTTKDFNINSSKKYNPREKYFKKNIIQFKKNQLKFKSNINDQISQLNQYTNKCNTELIKLIDGNNDNNFKERKEKNLNKNKLDIKNILIDEKKSKNKSENQIQFKEKEKVKDTIKSLIKSAIYDSVDKKSDYTNPKIKEKLLKRHINHITDEEALNIIEDIVEKGKELDIREIIGINNNLSKRENNMNIVRQKVENNYIKMIKLKNILNIDKTKFLNSHLNKFKIHKK